MAAITTMVAVASLAVGATAAVSQHRNTQAAQAEQRKRLKEQKTAAQEAAGLKGVEEDTGAKVKLGADDDRTANGKPISKKGTAVRTSTTGLGTLGVSPSKIGGL